MNDSDDSLFDGFWGLDFNASDDSSENSGLNLISPDMGSGIVIQPNVGLRSEGINLVTRTAIKPKSKKRRESRHVVKSNSALVPAKAPNMSRRVRGLTLCAFPSFDKCDSLLFFPVTMVKCLNSDDFSAFKKLLSVHLHRDCQVDFKGTLLSVRKYFQTMKALSGLHPDKMSCVQDTKVIDDSIHATVYCKFTDNVVIFDSFSRSKKEEYPFVFPDVDRSERWRRILSNREKPATEEEKRRTYEVTSSDKDLVVYGYMKYCLKFDYVSRKVVRFDYIFNLTSVDFVSTANM